MSYTYPGPQTPESPRREGRSMGKKIALFGCLPATLVALLVVGGCAVVGGAFVNEVDKAVKADQKEDKRAMAEDVTVLGCAVKKDEFGYKTLDAKVKITNNGSERADYIVEGEYIDQKGDKVEELFASVSSLEPGKSSTQDFAGMVLDEQLKSVTEGTCKVLEVYRSEWSAAKG